MIKLSGIQDYWETISPWDSKHFEQVYQG